MIAFSPQEDITAETLEHGLAREFCPTCQAPAVIRVYSIQQPEGWPQLRSKYGEVPGLIAVCDRCKGVAMISISYPMTGGVEFWLRWSADYQRREDRCP